MLTNKIDEMMKDQSDYKSFYYRPISANHHRVVKESMDRSVLNPCKIKCLASIIKNLAS